MHDTDSPPTTYRCPYCDAGAAPDTGLPGEAHGDLPCRVCGRVLWFVRKDHDGAVVLAFLPGLMTGSEPVSRVEEIYTAIGPAQTAVLNLAHLRFVSSVFLSMLVALHRRMGAEERHMRLCNLPAVTREAFETTRLDTLFAIFDDEAAALSRT